jgi:ABC-type branched-subunit amino acid transport system substrate-binding protein
MLKPLLIALLACIGLAPVAHAEDIVIGQTADLSSVAGGQMRDFNAGAKLYLDAVNARGGIGGRRVSLLTMDDAYVAQTAAKNAEALLAKPEVVALFGTRGSDPTDAVIKVAEREHVALIAPVNGADAVRQSKAVFPVRASYKSEVDGVLRYLDAGGGELVVVAQDDKFGRPLLDYIQQRVQGGSYKNLHLAGSVVLERKATQLLPQVNQVLALKPRSVIALCNPTTCSELVKQLDERTKDNPVLRPTVAQLSNVDMRSQFEKVGTAVVGNPFVQVMPDPNRPSLQISREFVAAATARNVAVNYRSYEGYVSAAVLVEGLRHAKTISRQGVHDAMESLGSANIGGITVEYTPAKRTGSTYVELVSLDAQGRLLR